MYTMTKQELIKKIADDAEVTQKQAAAMLDSFMSAVTDAVAAGDKIQLTGFGTFECKTRNARTGFNPITKAPVEIPETKVPSFKAGKAFKDAVAK